MSILFRSEKIENTMLDPRQEFAPVTSRMEIRFDPLTGRSTRLAHYGAIKPQPLKKEDYELKGFCPFCPPNLKKITSRFPADFLPEGYLQRGECTLIANIAPYDVYSGVLVLSGKHVLTIGELTEDILTDALLLGMEFFHLLKKYDPQVPYHFMGWNYMPPSGGGLVHPHIQIFGGKNPGNIYLDSLQGSKKYLKENGRSFWQDYIDKESKTGERYIAETGKIHWLVPFAPLGVLGDVLAVIPGISMPQSMTPDIISDLVKGIRSLFNYFSDRQIHSFNASFFFGSEGFSDFPVQVRFSPRTFLNTRYYPPDTSFFHVLLQQPICVVSPEEISREIRVYF